MQYAKQLLDSISKAISQPNGRKLRRKERALRKNIDREFDRQARFIISRSEKLFSSKAKGNKGFEEEIEKIFGKDWVKTNKKLLVRIKDGVEDALEFGAESRIKQDDLAEIGISFEIVRPEAIKFLNARALIYSKIPETTKNLIKPILLEALETGQSYQKTSKIIKDNYGFSKSRSQMIATNEIGNAYEEGNYQMMEEVQKKGFKVEKKWLTVGDDDVTEECKAYQDMGWISFKKKFTTSGVAPDDRSPRHSNPRCRCTTLYQYE